MNRIFKRVSKMIKFTKSRIFALSAFSLAFAAVILGAADVTSAVYINVDGQTSVKFTAEQDVNKILESEGIEVGADDVVTFSGFSQNVAQITVDRAFPVFVRADGQTQTVKVVDGTIEDVLEKAGVSYDGNDKFNVSLQKVAEENDVVILERIDYDTTVEYEDIPYEVVYKETSLLGTGVQRVLTAGQNGVMMTTYMQKTVDGDVSDKQKMAEDVIQQPTDQVVLVGSRTAISPLDFGYTIQNGVPTSYSRVLTNCVATGYSARTGAKTASGRYAVTGHVAVDPNVIPYGTKLYITSADNQFIYGYAVAADTGTGLLDGIVDVDLFYDTYYESCLNGRRIVNIYVLE